MTPTPSTRLPTTPARSLRRMLTRLTTLAFAALVMMLGSANPAFAHDQLLSSEPAQAAVLASSPAQVALEFSDNVLTVGAVILVVDQGGKDWAGGAPTLEGPMVSVPIDGSLPDGAYEARWRVVSSDGHPISGIVPFTVGDAKTAEQTQPEELDSLDARETALPAGSDASASTSLPNEASEPSDFGRTIAIGAAGAASALLVFIVWSLRKRAKNTPSDPSSRRSESAETHEAL